MTIIIILRHNKEKLLYKFINNDNKITIITIVIITVIRKRKKVLSVSIIASHAKYLSTYQHIL